MYYTTYNSPIGKLTVVSDGKFIYKVVFDNLKNNTIYNDDLEIFKKVKNYFDKYFNGEKPHINFNLKPQGSEFRLKVWKKLSQIPYGKTKTYGEIARDISPTMAAQAIGGAVGANPIAIIIPCHRVLGTNNKLTGYAAGIDKKIELLKLENIINFTL